MKNFNRKIKNALIVLTISLVAFIGFSKVGILFSASNVDVITVSTTKKTFDPNNYVASMNSIINSNKNNIVTTKENETTHKQITTSKITTTVNTTTTKSAWSGDVLSKSKGVVHGPSGKETYYNLNMNRVIKAMRNMGYTETDYPYWVREDGVKMLGKYVMVAANYEIRPKGTIIESSLGEAIVCDTGGFVKNNPTQIDIAVTWR